MPPHTLIVVTLGLAFASIVGGLIAIIKSAKSHTDSSLPGTKRSTVGVGVALVGIGLLMVYCAILLWEV